jgi:hypothetical protein
MQRATEQVTATAVAQTLRRALWVPWYSHGSLGTPVRMGCIGTKMECYAYSQVMATAVADRCEVRTLLIDVVHLNGFVAALSYAHVCAIVRHATCIGLSARSCGPSCNSLT